MAAASSASSSLSKYLKEKYQDSTEEEKKKKKKKKKAKPANTGLLVVDEDPIWQKPVKLEEEEDNGSADEEKPQVDEDIEVKRMKRLEQLRSRRPYGAISEDGSGWVSVSDESKMLNSDDIVSDFSPPRQRRADTPSPEHQLEHSGKTDVDLSHPRKQWTQNNTPPLPDLMPSSRRNADLSPQRKRRARNDSPSPGLDHESSKFATSDLSPPRRRQKHNQNALSDPVRKRSNSSGNDAKDQSYHDISPQYRQIAPNESTSPRPTMEPVASDVDFSPPRRVHQGSSGTSLTDLSPPRKVRKGRSVSDDLSAQQPSRISGQSSSALTGVDLSPPRKTQKESHIPRNRPRTGLVTGKDIKEEIAKTKKDDWLRFKAMDPAVSGRGAEPVYRDKVTGQRMSKEEFFKSQKKEEKPKEVKLEWGKGLAQKRENEARLQELEQEKDKPFARSRDDPDLDRMLKGRLRWGDPMAHLVKKKQLEPVLPDFGDNEKMKESGFVIPQEVPNHSWIKRGLDAAPNRYGIKPGRHWDGVDRSNGYEKQLFKRINEKHATEREAYLWSVSDM